MADDLGFNDVPWHNQNVFAPNLERLARTGVILEQSYVQPICTPTRSALMTGRYPIHTGRQNGVLWPEEPAGLFTNLTLLPEYLRELGYDTHMVGKWHLGFCNESYLPTHRGFNSYSGYWTGSEDYYLHSRVSSTEPRLAGYDFREQDEVDRSAAGKYSAHLFAERAVTVIQAAKGKTKPMFLYLAFQSVHSPLQVPVEYESHYMDVNNRARRTYLGMVTAMDEAIGNITSALKTSGLDKNTLIVFTTDNGGQTLNGGNNFPLRGNKATLWEGGTRGAAFVHGSMLEVPGRRNFALLHVTDWLPTLLSAGGGRPGQTPHGQFSALIHYCADLLPGIDGVDQWETLVRPTQSSKRREMLYNIDPLQDGKNGHNAAIRVGKYKLIKGNPGKPSGWIPPPAVTNIDARENDGIFNDLEYLYNSPELCPRQGPEDDQVLLFDLSQDPNEQLDLSKKYPNIVMKLKNVLSKYHSSMIPPDVKDKVAKGNPSHFGNIWSTGWCQAEPSSFEN